MKIQILLISLVLILCLHDPVFSKDAVLTNIAVTNTRDDLLLYMDVEGAFREKMEHAILNGVPTSFSFFISLHRKRSYWLNEKIADINVVHTLKYTNLKKEFTVTRSWEPDKQTITKSFDEAKKLMSEIKSLHIVPLNMLKKGSHYRIKAKAELSKLTLPLYLHYALFFVSLWDFETDWYTIDFTY